MRVAIIALLAIVLAGCNVLNLRDNRTFLFDALDTQPDGYSMSEEGVTYTIVETLASDTTLCRVVEIDQPYRFEVESFCKLRGGLWR